MYEATQTRPAGLLDRGLLDPRDVAREYTIPENTQAVWRSTNRYGFGDLVIKLGRGVRYRRSDLERWLDSRRVSCIAQSGCHE
jgi:hypothetical protein